FTLRGMIIGSIGAIVLTMSSMYVALKLGALPWPIIFVALVSMFFLKLFGNTNINEINATHTAMSAGAMTAGGLAFTLPGIYGGEK
ncbi:MAG: OPT/YSL family transporter, partial [Anaerovorax sp.]